MSTPPLRLPRPNRTRKSRAEQAEETRQAVKQAVVDCVAEVGFKKTTATEIARRAGVTWGAVQHHFGDKDGILMAVLEESFEQFARTLGEPPADAVDLGDRARIFVQRAWEHLGSAQYRTTLEILLNLPADLDPSWSDDVLAEWTRIWREFFADSSVSAQETFELMHYTISVLSGLATTKTLEGAGAAVRHRELDFLSETLERHLAGPSDEPLGRAGCSGR